MKGICQIGVGLHLAGCSLTLTAQSLPGSGEKKEPSSNPAKNFQPSGDAPAQIAFLIIPRSAETARIALTYNKQVGWKQVQQEIANLARFAGGQIAGSIEIKDYSLNPGNLRRFPVTTSAEFDLQTSQFQDSEPRLLPYLQAFRGWRSLDILFHLPGAQSNPAVSRFQSPVLNVWFHRDNGVYRYHAEIGEGKAELPLPSFLPESPADSSSLSGGSTASVQTGTTNVPASRLPLMLILAGSGLICGVLLYFLAVRRSVGNISINH